MTETHINRGDHFLFMAEWLRDILDGLGINGFLSTQIYGNALSDYLLAALVFLIAFTVLKFFKWEVLNILKRLAKRTKSDFDDMLIAVIDTLGWPLYILVAVNTAAWFIVLPDMLDMSLYFGMVLVAVYYIIKAAQKAVDFSVSKIDQRREGQVNRTIVDLAKKLLKGLAWLMALLFILTSMGVDISGAILGLGVGGIVIGFALQSILSDLFASFSLYFDRPFEKGDFIIIGPDDMGVVENIGLMSTRIKHLKGHELVVSNSELVSTRINNYKKMKKRRIVFSFGVTYQTPTKKLERIPGIVKELVDKTEHANLDRVHFSKFGDSALNFEVVYYVDSQDYGVYMDTQQAINLALKRAMEKEKVEFAYPTQTIFLEK